MRTIRQGKIFNDKHPNLNRDWVIGDFIKDPMFQSEHFEFKFQHGDKGHFREPKEVLNPGCRTMCILIHGKVRIKFVESDSEYFIESQGDYVIWEPDEPHEFEFLENTLVITLRWNK